MSGVLAGRVALVTGASRGLGSAIAIGLARAGADVAVFARSADDLESVASAVRECGRRALVIQGSVTRPGDLSAAVDEIERSFGRLDVLVNNAGISPHLRRSEELSNEDWQGVMDVNLNGVFYSSRAAHRLLAAAGRASVINMSSIHTQVGMGRLLAYIASKGAIEAMTKTLAVEWAEAGIRVNALAPGYFETDLWQAMRASEAWRSRLLAAIPAHRFAMPEELVPAAVFLASDASAYMTGTILRIDGGWSAGWTAGSEANGQPVSRRREP